MGTINLLHDESWQAARLVVKHFEARLDDAELTESFHIVREIVAMALERYLEKRDRELMRLAKKVPGCHD